MISHDISIWSKDSLNISEKIPQTGALNSPMNSGMSNNLMNQIGHKEEVPDSMRGNQIAVSPPTSPRKKNFQITRIKVSKNPGFKVALHYDNPNIANIKEKVRKSVQSMINDYRRRKSYKLIENLSDLHYKIIADQACPEKRIPSDFKGKIRKKSFLDLKIFMIICFSITSLREIVRTRLSVFNPNAPGKILWDGIIMILSFIRLVQFSLEKSFMADLNNKFFETTLLIFLYADVLINSNTKIYANGKEVADRKKIIKYLFTVKALTELSPVLAISLSCFLGGLHYTNELNIILVFKLPKFIDILKRIKEWLVLREKAESLFNLIILFSKILLWAHFFACMWHIVGQNSVESDDPRSPSWIRKLGIEDQGWKIKYLHSIYWSVTTMLTVGYGDITPTNSTEMFFNICSMFLGCGMFGYSMSRIAEILRIAYRADRHLEEQMDKVSLMLRDKRLPLETQTKVKKYLEFVWKQEQREDPENEKVIMAKLSSKLRDEIYYHTNVKYLKRIPAFRIFKDDTLIKLATAMKKIRVSPEEYIYKSGEREELCVFFVLEGCLDLIKESENTARSAFTRLNQFKKDDYFGLQESFTGFPRTLGVVSKGFSTLFKLSRRDILKILQKDSVEYEKFCKLRDLDLVYNLKENYRISCNSCNFTDHTVDNCNFLKFKPTKFIIIGAHLQKKRKFAKTFKRRRISSRNPLMDKITVVNAHNDLLEIYKEDRELIELSKFYEDLNTRLDQSSQDNSPDHEDHKDQENPWENTRDNPGFEISKSIKTIKQHSLSSLKPPQKNPLSIITQPDRVPSSSSLKMEKGRYSGTFVTGGTASKSLTGTVFKSRDTSRVQHKEPNEKWDVLEMDKIKSFNFYFPNNNIENVIRKIDASHEKSSHERGELHLPLHNEINDE